MVQTNDRKTRGDNKSLSQFCLKYEIKNALELRWGFLVWKGRDTILMDRGDIF